MIGSRCHVVAFYLLLCVFNYNVRGNAIVTIPTEESANKATNNKTIEISATVPSQLTTAVNSINTPSGNTKPNKVDDFTVAPTYTPSTIPSDPDVQSNTSTTSTTAATPTTTVPTSTTKSTTISTTTASTTSTSTTITSSTTSIKPTATSTTSTPVTSATTAATTAAPVPHHRQFDGPSFIGGIVLASGLMAIGFVAFKFYKARTERNYHTL